MKSVLSIASPFLALACLAGVLSWLPAIAPASPAELTEVAIGYMKAEKYELAREAYRQVLAREPQNFRALYGFGMMAYEQRHWEEAERYLKQANGVDPKNLEVLLTLGAVYEKAGGPDRAAAVYGAILRANPNHAGAHYNLGKLLLKQLRDREAKPHLEAYLRDAPQASDAVKVRRFLDEIDKRLKKDIK